MAHQLKRRAEAIAASRKQRTVKGQSFRTRSGVCFFEFHGLSHISRVKCRGSTLPALDFKFASPDEFWCSVPHCPTAPHNSPPNLSQPECATDSPSIPNINARVKGQSYHMVKKHNYSSNFITLTSSQLFASASYPPPGQRKTSVSTSRTTGIRAIMG